MDVRIQCPHCSAAYKVPEAFIQSGGKGKCKRCHRPFTIEGDKEEYSAVRPSVGGHGDLENPTQGKPGSAATKECPSCSETIRAGAKKCRFCGELIPTGSQIACPSCRRVFPPGTKLCVSCGYDFKSGQRLGGAAAQSPTAGSLGRFWSSASRQQLLTVLLGAVTLVGVSQFLRVKIFRGDGLPDTWMPIDKTTAAAAAVLALGILACLVQRKGLATVVALCCGFGLYMATLCGILVLKQLEFVGTLTTYTLGLGAYGTFLGGIVMAVCATRLWLRETPLPSDFVRDEGLAVIYFFSIGPLLTFFIADLLS